MSRIIKVPGKNPGTHAYIYEGYSYNVDHRGKKNAFHCSSKTARACKGTLKKKKDGTITTTNHNHKPDAHLVEKKKMIKEMVEQAEATTCGLKQIFDNVCRRNPAVAKHISYRTIRNVLEKARAWQRPRVPHSLLELHKFLKVYEPMKGFYQGIVKTNKAHGLLFSSATLLEALANALELYMDGTFDITPRVPKIMQVYSIHIRQMDVGIGAVFLLTEKRTAGLYRAMWKKLFKLVPTLKENVKFIMTDYERAAILAAKSNFANAEHHGCWFHYCQALRRRWMKLGLAACHWDVLWMGMSLALAPDSMFEEGLAIMHSEAKKEAKTFPKILDFLNYVKRTWAPQAATVSVHGCPVRTNNFVESFHSVAKDKLGGPHPNIWTFLDKLKDVIKDLEINLGRIEEGEAVHRARPAFRRDRDTNIRDHQEKLVSGRMSLGVFLRSFHEQHRHNFGPED